MCSGHFTVSMGLPCTHMMIKLKDEAISLDLVHSHWRIDTKIFTTFEKNMICEGDEFKDMFTKLQEKYNHGLSQQEHAKEVIS